MVTLHDVSFIAHPEWFGWREGLRRRWLAGRAAAAARTVVAVSEFSRQEILRCLDTGPTRVRVVHNGVTALADRAATDRSAADPLIRGAGLERRSVTRTATDRSTAGPLILYVGALFARRRLPVLLAAFERVVRDVPGAELFIVGPNRSRPREDLRGIAEACGIAARVTFLS